VFEYVFSTYCMETTFYEILQVAVNGLSFHSLMAAFFAPQSAAFSYLLP